MNKLSVKLNLLIDAGLIFIIMMTALHFGSYEMKYLMTQDARCIIGTFGVIWVVTSPWRIITSLKQLVASFITGLEVFLFGYFAHEWGMSTAFIYSAIAIAPVILIVMSFDKSYRNAIPLGIYSICSLFMGLAIGEKIPNSNQPTKIYATQPDYDSPMECPTATWDIILNIPVTGGCVSLCTDGYFKGTESEALAEGWQRRKHWMLKNKGIAAGSVEAVLNTIPQSYLKERNYPPDAIWHRD